MKVGTIDLLVKEKTTVKRRRASINSGFGNNGGKPNRGNGGGGGNDYSDNFTDNTGSDSLRKYGILILFLFLLVLMIFGILISVYVIIGS